MASNDIEVEIKLISSEDEFSKVKENLKKTAKFLNKTTHKDEYFIPSHRNFLEPKFPFEWLSIRTRGGKAILNYKNWKPNNAEIHTHCDEFQTEVGTPEKLEKIFSMLGIKKMITVDKTRESWLYNNEFEIALDTVKDLGHFIEIEAIKDFGSVDETREKLMEFATRLGADTSKIDNKGYPLSLIEKLGGLKYP